MQWVECCLAHGRLGPIPGTTQSPLSLSAETPEGPEQALSTAAQVNVGPKFKENFHIELFFYFLQAKEQVSEEK